MPPEEWRSFVADGCRFLPWGVEVNPGDGLVMGRNSGVAAEELGEVPEIGLVTGESQGSDTLTPGE